MPTPKQMEKLAAEAARRPAVPAAAPDERFRPNIGIVAPGPTRQRRRSDATAKASEIQHHVLRVSCRRCERTVEIQTVMLSASSAATPSGKCRAAALTTLPHAPAGTKKTVLAGVERVVPRTAGAIAHGMGNPQL